MAIFRAQIRPGLFQRWFIVLVRPLLLSVKVAQAELSCCYKYVCVLGDISPMMVMITEAHFDCTLIGVPSVTQ